MTLTAINWDPGLCRITVVPGSSTLYNKAATSNFTALNWDPALNGTALDWDHDLYVDGENPTVRHFVFFSW